MYDFNKHPKSSIKKVVHTSDAKPKKDNVVLDAKKVNADVQAAGQTQVP